MFLVQNRSAWPLADHMNCHIQGVFISLLLQSNLHFNMFKGGSVAGNQVPASPAVQGTCWGDVLAIHYCACCLACKMMCAMAMYYCQALLPSPIS
jgi:hypothetical protein